MYYIWDVARSCEAKMEKPIEKTIEIGKTVKVITGAHKGKSGQVVKIINTELGGEIISKSAVIAIAAGKTLGLRFDQLEVR